jgi:hypothetical protein
LSSSCDADRLWPRFPIPDDLFSVAEMALFVSSIDCSVHEGDPRKLHLMDTAHLNEKKSISQVPTGDSNARFSKQATHKRWAFARSEQEGGGWMQTACCQAPTFRCLYS